MVLCRSLAMAVGLIWAGSARLIAKVGAQLEMLEVDRAASAMNTGLVAVNNGEQAQCFFFFFFSYQLPSMDGRRSADKRRAVLRSTGERRRSVEQGKDRQAKMKATTMTEMEMKMKMEMEMETDKEAKDETRIGESFIDTQD
jgi:hypothetical protein